MLVSSTLPVTVADVLPGAAEVSRCDVHLLASQNDGRNAFHENILDVRVDFAPFHFQSNLTRPLLGRSLSFGVRVTGALTQQEASELVFAGVNYLVLATGFFYLRPDIAQLRGAVGLPSREHSRTNSNFTTKIIPLRKSHGKSHVPNRHDRTEPTPSDKKSFESGSFRHHETIPTDCIHLIIPRSWVRSPPALPEEQFRAFRSQRDRLEWACVLSRASNCATR